MTTKSERTEIELLKKDVEQLGRDVSDLKDDVKEIKENHLSHIWGKLNSIDKKVAVLSVQVTFWAAIGSLIASAIVQVIIKYVIK